MANHWFKEKRGLATGILTASTATGQLILLPVLGVAAYGGGLAYKYFNTYTWAFFMAGVFCVVASLFVVVVKKQPTTILIQDELVNS